MRLIMMILICGVGVATADYVELRDGRRLEGRIVEETPEEIQIEVGANAAGTIRQVVIIHAREIRTWSVDRERREEMDGEEADAEEGMGLRPGIHQVEALLRNGESLVASQEYDAAIEQFQEAADLADVEFEGQSLSQRVEALDLRRHALRLMEAALDGKLNHLDSLAGGSEAEIRRERRRLEREWGNLQDEIREEEARQERTRRTELGGRHRPTDLEERETRLREQIALLNEREGNLGEFNRRLNEERVRTEAMREITRERVRRATDAFREARRNLRRQR